MAGVIHTYTREDCSPEIFREGFSNYKSNAGSSYKPWEAQQSLKKKLLQFPLWDIVMHLNMAVTLCVSTRPCAHFLTFILLPFSRASAGQLIVKSHGVGRGGWDGQDQGPSGRFRWTSGIPP